MERLSASILFVGILVVGLAAGARAQGTQQNMPGGTANSGTGVTTGVGPLNQPIAPATSVANPRQNVQQNMQRPQNIPGPAQTNPGQNPFGSR
jgi:hypothetical protein